jgi:hypothetical protein
MPFWRGKQRGRGKVTTPSGEVEKWRSGEVDEAGEEVENLVKGAW